MLFDGVSYGSIVAGESEGDISFGVGMSVVKMRRLVERWKITSENLTLWWTSLKCVKPMNVGDNLYGLALMSARDEIFAIYCDRAVANIPMAPSVKNFNEITSDENFFINDLESERLRILYDDDRILGLSTSTVIGEKRYESIVYYLLSECFSAIGGGEIGEIFEQGESIWKILSRAQELIKEKGLKKLYDDWFKSSAVADLLKKAIKAKTENDVEFRRALLSTEKALLVTVIGRSEENENDDTDFEEDFKKVLTIGLTDDELNDFLRDLRPSSTITFQFWTRCEAVSPGRLGSNLWAACLMDVRRTISVSATDEEMETISADETNLFWNLDSIPEKASISGKRLTKKRQVAHFGKDRLETKLSSEAPKVDSEIDRREIKEEIDNEALLVLPPMPDALQIKNNVQEEEREIVAALQPIIDAIRNCPPLFERIISSMETNEGVKEFGEQLGKQMLAMFGGNLPDLASLTDEDMFNLGRIAACQVNGSQ